VVLYDCDINGCSCAGTVDLIFSHCTFVLMNDSCCPSKKEIPVLTLRACRGRSPVLGLGPG